MKRTKNLMSQRVWSRWLILLAALPLLSFVICFLVFALRSSPDTKARLPVILVVLVVTFFFANQVAPGFRERHAKLFGKGSSQTDEEP